MSKKLIAALMGTLFAIGALSGSAAFAGDKEDGKKDPTKEETKK